MAKEKESKPTTELAESRLLISYAFDLARNLGIKRLLVLADLLQDRRAVEKHRDAESIIWVVRGEDPSKIESKRGDHCIEIPETEVERMEQVKLALILAVLRQFVGVDDSVVCLTGAAGSKRLDSLVIANPRRDFPWFSEHQIGTTTGKLLTSREFARLLEIALRFATEGREGKPIGTTFVLGDPEALKPYLRPLIMNPCEGHPRKARQIYNAEFLETLRELASLDGAFVVDRRGVVESAGVYLDAPISKKVKVAKGLGARHTSAAAISAKNDAIALVISESSRTLTVFSQGAPVVQIGRGQ